MIRINIKDELSLCNLEGKWNDYIGNEVLLDGEKIRIRIAIKKKISTNYFWIHNIDEYKKL